MVVAENSRRTNDQRQFHPLADRFFADVVIGATERRASAGGTQKISTSSGGVPYVCRLSEVSSPQAWPFLRSSSVHRIGSPSGASSRRAPALSISTRFPPGSYTHKKNVCWMACL